MEQEWEVQPQGVERGNNREKAGHAGGFFRYPKSDVPTWFRPPKGHWLETWSIQQASGQLRLLNTEKLLSQKTKNKTKLNLKKEKSYTYP